jgi:hypothetical protein
MDDRELLARLKRGGLETAKEWTWEASNREMVRVLNSTG